MSLNVRAGGGGGLGPLGRLSAHPAGVVGWSPGAGSAAGPGGAGVRGTPLRTLRGGGGRPCCPDRPRRERGGGG